MAPSLRQARRPATADVPRSNHRRRWLTGVLFAALFIASAGALGHAEQMPEILLLAPGYLVQAWLFERHWALGGLGYRITVIGVSALVWTALLLGIVGLGRRVGRRLRGRRDA
jgi:hypothetical protein